MSEQKGPEEETKSRTVSNKKKHILIGSAVVFFVSLGVLIPALGLFIGPIFTFGGGFAGGATVGYLRSEGGRAGAKYGVIAALLGGIPSSVVGVIGGTIGNALVLGSQGGGGDSGGALLVFAIFGLISGIIFKLIGGALGGGLVGWFFDEEAH